MARKEERERKAEIRADQYSHPVDWNQCYHHWIEGAEWADRTMLDKVCEWLKCNLPYSSKPPYQLIEDLRKTMEE